MELSGERAFEAAHQDYKSEKECDRRPGFKATPGPPKSGAKSPRARPRNLYMSQGALGVDLRNSMQTKFPVKGNEGAHWQDARAKGTRAQTIPPGEYYLGRSHKEVVRRPKLTSHVCRPFLFSYNMYL